MAEHIEIDPDPTKERDDEIEKLMKVLNIIINELGEDKVRAINDQMASLRVDLDLSDDLAGVLMTVYTCLRKEANDKKHDKYKAYTAKICDMEVSIAMIVDKIKASNIELNFLIATPIVEIMTLFKSSFDEVRTGVTRFRVRSAVAKRGIKRGPDGKPIAWDDKLKEHTQNISSYGLVNHHIPLLQGITFVPERRTGVVRSLGPLAQAILMVMEDRYHTKLVGALGNSLMMLPMANEIVNCLKDARSPGSVAGILRELGDILLITTARSTQKIYFPLLLIKIMWGLKPTLMVGNWSFSGVSMLKYYHTMVKKGLKFIMKTGGDSLTTSEVIFHAMFGTYLEDLGILSQITSKTTKWHQRKDLNPVFHKRATKNKVEIMPINFTHVSKLAQSLLTKSLGNVDPCGTSRPSFSGFRKRSFTQEFLSFLTTGRAVHSYSSDPMQLQFALKKTKDMLLEDKDSPKILAGGTRAWEKFNGAAWVVADDFIPVEGNVKFYGINA